MPKTPAPVRTKRNGSFAAFDRRYNALPSGDPEDGTILHDDFRNMAEEHTQAIDEHRFWTVLDCDGKLLIAPGKWFVNRFGYIITEHAYDEQETRNTPYVY